MTNKILELAKEPAFWDIFGLVTFTYIIIISIMLLTNNVPNIYIWILLLIGIVGVIIDSLIVYNRFFIIAEK